MLQYIRFGIIGGGQLGAMLIRSAMDFGVKISVMDKNTDVPCAKYCSSFFTGDSLSFDDVIEFGSNLDVITIEKEAVNTKALRVLQQKGVRVYPSPDVIEIIQNKLLQKEFLKEKGLPTVPAIPVFGKADILAKINKYPKCLKLCTQGYDGRGVMMLHNEQDLTDAFEEPSILEDVVTIKHELSVIVGRNEKGDIECYDPVMMYFDKERHILDFQLCPAQINRNLSLRARQLAIKIAEVFELVGILAVEMFVTEDGELYVNEVAPRPHNSGHHSIEACATSQYEQLVRIMIGLPLGDARHTCASVMINILEPRENSSIDIRQALNTILGFGGVHVHWYGKINKSKGRKVGHITVTENNIENALSKAANIKNILNKQYENA
jgi:5-(carboxyamino)imidazole ribonucleotide synthase